MTEKMPQYEPSPAEMRKAESMMSKKQKDQSEIREDALFEGIKQGRSQTEIKNSIPEEENNFSYGIDFKKIKENENTYILGEEIFSKNIADEANVKKYAVWATCARSNNEKTFLFSIKIDRDRTRKFSFSNSEDLKKAYELVIEFIKNLDNQFSDGYIKLINNKLEKIESSFSEK
jgi:hypothetical protein